MKSTPFGYLVALVLGIAIGIAVDDQLLQPAAPPKPFLVNAQNNPPALAKPEAEPAAPRQPDVPVAAEEREPAMNPAPAETPLQAEAPAEVDAPKLVVEQPTFDFGTRESGTDVEHTFILENAGTAPLKIDQMHQMGGINFDPPTREIAAGERIELKATLSLAAQKGPVRREIILHSNDPVASRVALAFVGTAEPRIKADPMRLNFGKIDGQQPASTTFTVSGQQGLTFNILDTKTSGTAISAEVKVVTPGKEYEVTATISPPLKAGHLHGWIHLTTDQRGEYHRIAVPLTAQVDGAP